MTARRFAGASLLALALVVIASPSFAIKERLLVPAPLRNSLSLGFGVQEIASQPYADFFGEDYLNSWTFRYQLRLLRGLHLSAGLTTTGKNRVSRQVSIDSEAYPVTFNFASFQMQTELGLRLDTPRLFGFDSYLAAATVWSRVHVTCEGNSGGYDATWEEYRPAIDVVQHCSGWQIAAGLHRPIWANVSLLIELSENHLETYGAPVDRDPPVGTWNHSGRRLMLGLLQRF